MSTFSNAVNANSQGTQYLSSSGIWSGIDAGTATQVLTSNGTGVAPSFQAAPVSGYSAASIVVSPTSGQGNYTTIGAALSAASSGQDILIKAGTYTENPSLVAGVNLVAWDVNGLTPIVTIVGKCSFSSSGTVSITGIKLQTNGDYAVAVTGSSPSIVNLQNCYIYAQNHTAIDLSSSSNGAMINSINCQGNIGSSSNAIFTSSGAGQLNFNNCNFTNSATSVTANTLTAGTLNAYSSNFNNAITTSGSATVANLYNCQVITSSTISVTLGGTSSINSLFWNYLRSSSTSALSIGSGAVANVVGGAYYSGTNHAITGSGTLNYNDLSFTGPYSDVNTSTINNIPSGLPLSGQAGGTGNSNPSGVTIDLYGGAQGYVGTSDGSGNQTWQPPSVSASVTTVSTTPYTVLSTDQFLEVNTSSSAVTVNLLTFPPANSTIYICDYTGNAATNNITLNGGGTNINGAGTYTMANNYECVGLLYDGTEYLIYEGYNEGGGSSSISLTGDTGGTLTGSSFTIYADNTVNNCGSSVSISGSGTTLTLNVSDSSENTFVGQDSGNSSLSGIDNVGLGVSSLSSLTTGGYNTSIGTTSSQSITSGAYNVSIGYQSGKNLLTGSGNVIIGGVSAGTNYTGGENYNILIGYAVPGVTGENNVIRIGNSAGGSQPTNCYIQGISGSTLTDGSPTPYLCLVDATDGQVVSPTPVTAASASSTFGSLSVGFPVQNLANYPILVNVSLDIGAATGAQVFVGVDPTNTPVAQAVTDSFSTTGLISFAFVVPSKYYAEVTTTGTITISNITTFVTQIA